MNPNARDNRKCARCEHFGIAEHSEQAAHGLGRCRMFEVFVPWDGRFCVIFGPALDMARREPWIRKQAGRELSNAALACPQPAQATNDGAELPPVQSVKNKSATAPIPKVPK